LTSRLPELAELAEVTEENLGDGIDALMTQPAFYDRMEEAFNDLFYTKGRGIKTFKMYIYNRWGDLIFYTEDRTEGWDGRSNQGEKIYGR
jgi:gliding motility-associated-like protein